MKKITIFVTILLSINVFALANFTGHWSGPGVINSNIGIHASCAKIDIVIEQSDTEFVTKTYQSDCGIYGSKWGPNTMQIQGAKVFEDGQEVGSLTNDTLISVTPDTNVEYAFNLKLTVDSNGQPAVQTYYGAKNGVGAMVYEGVLSKVP